MSRTGRPCWISRSCGAPSPPSCTATAPTDRFAQLLVLTVSARRSTYGGGVADWVQVVVEVDENDIDLLSGALWAAGAGGIEERDASGARVSLVVGVEEPSAHSVVSVLRDA